MCVVCDLYARHHTGCHADCVTTDWVAHHSNWILRVAGGSALPAFRTTQDQHSASVKGSQNHDGTVRCTLCQQRAVHSAVCLCALNSKQPVLRASCAPATRTSHTCSGLQLTGINPSIDSTCRRGRVPNARGVTSSQNPASSTSSSATSQSTPMDSTRARNLRSSPRRFTLTCKYEGGWGGEGEARELPVVVVQHQVRHSRCPSAQ